MSTTSTKTTEEVMFEIESVLKTIGIKYEKEKWVLSAPYILVGSFVILFFSYVFHCSVPSYKESTSHKRDKIRTIRFDLEVCFLPRLEMLGTDNMHMSLVKGICTIGHINKLL